MIGGPLLGLLSAFGFGVSDTITTYAARRIGTFETASLGLLVSSLALGAFVLVSGLPFSSDPQQLLPAIALGVVLGIAYVSITRALRLGPLMVVGPITASGGAMTVLLSVLVLHDAPSPIQWAAVPITMLGVALAALVLDRPGGRPFGRGALFAGVHAVFLAVYYVGFGRVVDTLGAAQTAFVTRTVSALFAWTLLVFVLGRRSAARRAEHASATLQSTAVLPSDAEDSGAPAPRFWSWRPPRRVLGAIFVGGLVNAASLIVVSYALVLGPTSIVGLLALLSPAVVITAGFVLLRERLSRVQWLGVLLTAIGAVLATRG
ncbi:MAG: hypothetical protein QOH61_2313 [Chloroflexota bacterium]|nr:hypothetical protein [Chloroflexota bacterium]